MGFWKRLFGTSTPEDHAPDLPEPASRRDAQRRERERARQAGRPKRKVTKIRRDVLDMVFQAAEGHHPNEFAGSLRREGDTITELMLVPATQGGEMHAILPLYNLPVDMSICGTVHSHPTPNAIPSDADRQLFRTFGHTHIICGYPYNMESWRAYDHDAREITHELEVVDY